MEHSEDKIIRDKIDSLDSLPSGYEPSLQGKWELLESAMPERKSNRKYILAIAASIVMLLGTGLFFYKSTVIKQPEMANKSTYDKPGNNAQNIIINDRNSVPQTIIKSAKSNTDFTGKKDNVALGKTLPAHVVIAVNDSADLKIPNENISQENTFATTNTAQKKSKKRFVEIDFNDAETIQTKPETGLAENKIKFKVNILKLKQKTVSETPPATVLKLSKEFPINN